MSKSKGSDHFKESIEDHLEMKAFKSEQFRKVYENPKKNIEGCIAYILSEVQSSGINGFEDEEVFSMAAHYYHEDGLKKRSMPKGTIVVNHRVELSDDEIEEARSKAKAKITAEESESIKADLKQKLADKLEAELTPEELKEVREEAKKQAIIQATSEMRKKTVTSTVKSTDGPTLF